MIRGELWTMAGSGPYASKPRPVLIIQRDDFTTDSITICPLTSDTTHAPLLRIPIRPAPLNGLKVVSSLMIDEITTTRRSRLSKRIGNLTDQELTSFNSHAAVFLGIS